MIAYKKLSGNTGVSGYEILKDGIIIRFQDGRTYLYTNRSAGAIAIGQMKQLAAAGKGLTTFINRYVKEKYEKRIR
ncbi:MAG: hypothetical protein ACJ77K_13690 [Bacteroidia bacterium]